MEKTYPIFVYEDYSGRHKTHFIRAVLGVYGEERFTAVFPNYLEKTYGYLAGCVQLDDMDFIHDYPDGNMFIRILMQVYDKDTEEMTGEAWVYVIHPDRKEYKSLKEKEE
jgi:hypothetical protein